MLVQTQTPLDLHISLRLKPHWTIRELDIKDIRSYIIKNFSPDVWQDTYGKLKESSNLKSFPYSGSIPEELERLGITQYRQVISGMNKVIYEVRQEIIYIHIVVDTRKDMKSLLTRRLLRNH